MKNNTLSKEIENLEKKDFSVKEKKSSSNSNKKQNNVSTSKKIINSSINLPEVRKVALAKRRVRFVFWFAVFISCFSLSVFVGYCAPFMLFQ